MKGAEQQWRVEYDALFGKMRGLAQEFLLDCSRCGDIQQEILLSILRANATTPFGERCGFSSISSYEDYAARVPLTTYSDYEEHFKRGGASFSSSSRAKGFTLSSGSSSARKVLPLTEALAAEFSRALSPWLMNIFLQDPRCATGPGYWIDGPTVDKDDGFSDVSLCEDGDYFEPSIWSTLGSALVAVPRCGSVGDFGEWALVTLAHLLLEPELSWISVWSPTLLINLISYLPSVRDDLREILESGSFARVATKVAPSARESVLQKIKTRANTRKSALQILREERAPSTERLWPNLRVVSCWADGWARLSLAKLQLLFPQATIQPKGLLATEGVVSIPLSLSSSEAPVLAYRSHFFEFYHEESQTICLASEVRVGERYRVILTTGGGLYRYDLGDCVEIVGFWNEVPRVVFIGKTSDVSDLCGEKLHEGHVAEVFARVARRRGLDLAGAFLEPQAEQGTFHYRVRSTLTSERDVAAMLKELEMELSENPHYAEARTLRQLGPLRHEALPETCPRVSLSTAKENALRAQSPKRDLVNHRGFHSGGA